IKAIIEYLKKNPSLSEKCIFLISSSVNHNYIFLEEEKQNVLDSVEIVDFVKDFLLSLKSDIEKIPLRFKNEEIIPICCNIKDRNYAYFPQAKEIIQTIINFRKVPFIIHCDDIEKNNSLRQIAEDENFFNNGGCFYSIDYLINESSVIDNLSTYQNNEKLIVLFILGSLKSCLKKEYTMFLEKIIMILVNKLPRFFIFYFDIQRYLNNVRKIYITPEFGTNAQTLICLSNILNIKSIIVQPIASTPCKPYPLLVPSAIFCMDMIYKDKYIEKGYDKNIIFEMGSARMRNILRKSQKIKKMDLMPN
ncbi:TPA: hypothetical protein R1719_001655, partial [Campylobacter lari]|nr:hypothetical protein [Campylobacter lari]